MLRKTALLTVLLGVVSLLGMNNVLADESGIAKVQEIQADALQGTLPPAKPFGIGSSVQEMKNAFGEPIEKPGCPMLYQAKNLMINHDNDTITDLTWDYQSDVTISLEDIKSVLGEKPSNFQEYEGAAQISYKLSGKVLEFTLDNGQVKGIALK